MGSYPESISKEQIENLGSIAAKLRDLGYKKLYMGRDQSEKEFNDIGDDIVEVIEKVMDQIISNCKDEEEFD